MSLAELVGACVSSQLLTCNPPDRTVAALVCFLQSTSGMALPSDANVVLHFRWLRDLFPGISDSVLRTHPFYYFPQNQNTRSRRSFNTQFAASHARTLMSPNSALGRCREVMKKSSLTTQDLDDLQTQVERLCGYASATMPISYCRGQAIHVIDTLGTIFLVLDTLHCAAEVLGDNIMKHLWWPSITRRMESATLVKKRDFVVPGKCYRNAEIARTLQCALGYYREGMRPPILMVTGLKQALLCEPSLSSKFKAERWDAWRQDAAEWLRSIESGLSGRK